jgi:hypothetical protein
LAETCPFLGSGWVLHDLLWRYTYEKRYEREWERSH